MPAPVVQPVLAEPPGVPRAAYPTGNFVARGLGATIIRDCLHGVIVSLNDTVRALRILLAAKTLGIPNGRGATRKPSKQVGISSV